MSSDSSLSSSFSSVTNIVDEVEDAGFFDPPRISMTLPDLSVLATNVDAVSSGAF